MHIEAYGGQSVCSLGLCVMYLPIDNKIFPTAFEVTDTSGPIILGRKQAKAMGYVCYPAIKPPDISPTTSSSLHKVHAGTTNNPKSQTDIKTDIKGTTHNTKPQMDIKTKHVQENEPSAATQGKQSRQTDEPVLPKIKWNKDSIKLNDKVHRLPITKDLKEFSDVFKGVGTLPGGPYHIRLKDNYKPVQHPLRSVPIAMQPAYKAELE